MQVSSATNTLPVAAVVISRSRKSSVAYKMTMVLLVFMVWAFCRELIFKDLTGERLIPYIAVYYLPRLAVAFCFAVNLADKLDDGRLQNAALLLFAFLAVTAVSYFVNFSGFLKIIDVVTIMLAFAFYSRFRFKKGEVKCIFIITFIIVAAIIAFTAPIDDYSHDDIRFNPNSGAFVLAMLFFMAYAAFSKTGRVSYFAVMCACFLLQFVFGSRTAIVGIVEFTVLCVLLRARRKTFKPFTVVFAIVLLAAGSVLFAYYYSVVLYDKYGSGELIILGKDLFSGRQIIWRNAFEALKQDTWFGVGSRLNELFGGDDPNGVMNIAHNQSLGVLTAFGVIPSVLFFIYLAYAVSLPYRRNRPYRCNRMPAIFMIAVMTMAFFEVYFFQPQNYSIMLVAYAVVMHFSRLPDRKRRTYNEIDGRCAK